MNPAGRHRGRLVGRALRGWRGSVGRLRTERLRGTPCPTGRRSGRLLRSWLSPATRSARSESNRAGSVGSRQSPGSSALHVRIETGGLCSTSVTRLHHYYAPIRHPQRPTPPLTRSSLINGRSITTTDCLPREGVTRRRRPPAGSGAWRARLHRTQARRAAQEPGQGRAQGTDGRRPAQGRLGGPAGPAGDRQPARWGSGSTWAPWRRRSM